MSTLLFVCTANICRSPMAEFLMKDKLAKLGSLAENPANDWRVGSAGTWGMDGSDMAEGVRAVLEEMGIKPGRHFARTVTAEMLNAFDLILTMERGQKEAIKIEFLTSAERVYMLSEMVGERFDIRDPMGEPIDEFRQTAKIIDSILNRGFDRIKQFIGDREIR
jgi:protein-tyrosine phosphatase